MLHEKLAKKRQAKLKKLTAQQKKAKDELINKLGVSSDPNDLQVRSECRENLSSCSQMNQCLSNSDT